jgi:hypothetical protein
MKTELHEPIDYFWYIENGLNKYYLRHFGENVLNNF